MPYTLLLADASITIQRIVELTFASEDIAVVAFSDGEHAIASMDRSVPDIVLADVGLPGRSGYDISRYIKNSPPLAHIPVLLLTGAFEPIDQPKALEAGCDGILIKPFEPQFVIGRVKELLRRPRPGSKEDEVEQYFEELDKAFANLATSPPPAPAPEIQIDTPTTAVAPAERTEQAEPIERAEPVRGMEPVERVVPADHVVPVEQVVLTEREKPAEPVVAVESVVPVEPVVPIEPAVPVEPAVHAEPASAVAPAARPSLADAFAALLAAERSANGYKRPTPTLVTSSRSVPNDDVIERVTRRVLEQLSDAVVRETVTDIVQTTAERLVREEIERIKSNIK